MSPPVPTLWPGSAGSSTRLPRSYRVDIGTGCPGQDGSSVTDVLTPFDDYPIHQTPLPLAHPATGDPNHYDRFWFNGYTENYYFAAGMAVYPNRGIIVGAFSVGKDGVQRSVSASGRIPADRGETRIGPLSIEVVEPLRTTRVRVDAADLGIDADVTFSARSVALEEPRQTLTA